MVIFTKKFRTLDPHLPIVWDKVPKKNVFFTPSLIAMLCLQNPLRELHIATVAIHDDFDYTGLVNDIAILKTGIKDFYFL